MKSLGLDNFSSELTKPYDDFAEDYENQKHFLEDGLMMRLTDVIYFIKNTKGHYKDLDISSILDNKCKDLAD